MYRENTESLRISLLGSLLQNKLFYKNCLLHKRIADLFMNVHNILSEIIEKPNYIPEIESYYWVLSFDQSCDSSITAFKKKTALLGHGGRE